jgi:hypothetical protein
MDKVLEQPKCGSKGNVELDFSFLTNNTSAPLTSTLRGLNADWVASFTYVGVGILQINLHAKVKCRYVISKVAELEDLNAADDGAYATIGATQNDGGASAAMTFKVYTRVAAGTKTDFTGRRVNVRLVLKDSSVGV